MAFSYYREITIDNALVPNTNQTDFPVLVSGTYTYLKTTGNGGDVTNANGHDIGFYSDAALTTKLKWEVERYIATTGAVIFWVKVPTVSTSADTVIYMAYGDSGISTFQGDAVNVWDSNYNGVYHLPDGTTLTANDSTTNGNNGTLTNTPTAVSAEVGGGAYLPATASAKITGSNAISANNDFTIECIIKADSTNTGYQTYWSIGSANATNENILLYQSNLTTLAFAFNGATGFSVTVTDLSSKYTHVVCTFKDSTGVMEIFIDGAYAGTATSGSSFLGNGSWTLGIWDAVGIWQCNDTIFDEVRYSDVVRSDDWIATQYNSLTTPSTFYSVGTQQTPSSGTTVNPGTGVVTYTGVAPSVSVTANQNITTSTGVITYTGVSPSVAVTDNKNILAGTGAVTFTGFAPSVFASNLINVATSTGVVTYTGIAPVVNVTVSVEPGAGVITYTGYAPTASITSGTTVSTGTGIITFTGYAPTIQASVSVEPGAGVITFEGYAPTVRVPVNIATGTGVVTYTGYSPLFSTDSSIYIDTLTGELLFTGYAPVVRIKYVGTVIGSTPSGSSIISAAPSFGGSIISSKAIDSSIIEP